MDSHCKEEWRTNTVLSTTPSSGDVGNLSFGTFKEEDISEGDSSDVLNLKDVCQDAAYNIGVRDNGDDDVRVKTGDDVGVIHGGGGDDVIEECQFKRGTKYQRKKKDQNI